MPKTTNDDGLTTWIISQLFTTGILAFSMDLLKAFCLGVVGALGGLFARWIYNKYIKEVTNK